MEGGVSGKGTLDRHDKNKGRIHKLWQQQRGGVGHNKYVFDVRSEEVTGNQGLARRNKEMKQAVHLSMFNTRTLLALTVIYSHPFTIPYFLTSVPSLYFYECTQMIYQWKEESLSLNLIGNIHVKKLSLIIKKKLNNILEMPIFSLCHMALYLECVNRLVLKSVLLGQLWYVCI